MAFVRQSKFRHVFGKAAKKEQSQEGFRITNCAFEGTFIAANGKYVAFCVEVGGSGAFSVLSHDKKGRLEANLPKISAHKEYVLDFQWNPYNDHMIASCSEDGSIRIWDIPEGGLITNMEQNDALLTLDYHERRCVQIAWHPVASNIMLSVSQDPKVCVWNLDEGEVVTEIDNSAIIWNAAWSMKGDKIVTSCKDKKFRIFNARTGDLIKEGQGHEGSKAQRVIFTMDDKFLFSCGFSRMSERQYACWDATTMEEMNLADLDTANGCLIPYYDPDTQVVYIAAKGDSVIRYYELEDKEPYFHYITTFQSGNVQRGLSNIPKRDMTVNDCEVMRFYKLYSIGNTGAIEGVSFTVPRKSDIYQDDIYPDAISGEAALEATEWFDGKDAEPNRLDMSTKFVGKVAKKKAASGGGLKKGGGLKGLKAKKAIEGSADAPAAEAAPKPEAKEETPQESSSDSSDSASSPIAAATGDSSTIEDLQKEIKSLKASDAKHKDELKSLMEKNKKYEEDINQLLQSCKKNDERIAALEALANEGEEEE